MVARVENSIDLTEESPSYSVVPTCLVNPDIILPHNLFQERRGLPEIPPGRNPEPREYEMDWAQGLIDLDWSQQTPIFHPDDIDRDPQFTQYPFQEGDDLDDYGEEEMEVESRPLGEAGDASMAPPSNTRRTYQCLPATYSFRSTETPGSPRSTHTDTDTVMEMGGLSMAPGGPDLCHMTPRASIPLATQGTMSTLDLAATVARGVAAAATEILERFTRPLQVNEADHPLVDLAADAAIWERFQRCLATTPQAMPTGQTAIGRTSAFDWLGHRTPTSQEESKWLPHPEMTPCKIEHGRQPHKEQESERAVSQKRQSQSCPPDEADPKKGRTESKGKPSKIQPSIDWMTTGIQKPISKPDSRLPSSKSSASRTSTRSTLAKESQKQGSGSRNRTDASHTPNAQLGDPEKREIKDKPHRWIEARVRHLDPAGYMEEINSLRYFGRNAGCFALQIVAIADWGRKYMDVGFRYPIPVFPQFLFTPVPESYQGGSQVPARPSQVHAPGEDVRQRSREAWKWMVSILQFWGDEASTADGVVYRGCEHPVSTLVEHILNKINPGLDLGSKITWDDVVTRTPWLTKRLHGMMATQEMTVKCQALPVTGESLELKVVLEKRYSEQLLRSKGRGKLVAEKPTAPGHKPITSCPPG